MGKNAAAAVGMGAGTYRQVVGIGNEQSSPHPSRAYNNRKLAESREVGRVPVKQHYPKTNKNAKMQNSTHQTTTWR